MQKTQVLITGSRGNIGRCLSEAFQSEYDLRTFDMLPDPLSTNAFLGDLRDLSSLRSAMAGVEVLVHLAAVPNEAPFTESLVPHNIIGLYNTFEAAREAGVRRIVFASTCQTVMRYPSDATVEIGDALRPISLYGATKAFGEIVGRYYYDQHQIEFVGIRVGWFLLPDDARLHTQATARALWLSPGDAVRLFRCAIEKPGVGYTLVFGTSRTERPWVSLRAARVRLGFEPHDSVEDIFPKA